MNHYLVEVAEQHPACLLLQGQTHMELGETEHAQTVVDVEETNQEVLTGRFHGSELQQVCSLKQRLYIPLGNGGLGGRQFRVASQIAPYCALLLTSSLRVHIALSGNRVPFGMQEITYTIYTKVCEHPFKLVDSTISATPVADGCTKPSTPPCNLHRQTLAVEWPLLKSSVTFNVAPS